MKKLAILITVPIAAFAAAAVALAATVTIGTAHTSLGTVLVSSPNGHTLYLYEGDSGSHLGCTGGCLKFWPPVPGAAKVKVSGGAKAADIGSVKRGSGKQLTYKGHPLYWFAGDKKAGQVKGQGLVLKGKYWYAVSPSGSAMTASASKGGSYGGSSSGGSAGW